jgi:hypothetical protein
MAYNFLACDRDQAFLLPPDLRDWLPADHLAWFILDVVDQLDLGPFLKAYRADGHGRAAYDPRMLLAVLLYGYCTGIRSSRQIERRCQEDIAFRVLAGNSTPRSCDHRPVPGPPRTSPGRPADPVAEAVLRGRDGPPGPGRPGRHQGRGQRRRGGQPHSRPPGGAGRRAAPAGSCHRQAEDGEGGVAGGDGLPRALVGRAERLARLQRAKAQLEAEAAARQQRYQQRVADLAVGARARGQRPRAHIRPRRRDEAPHPKATVTKVFIGYWTGAVSGD